MVICHVVVPASTNAVPTIPFATALTVRPTHWKKDQPYAAGHVAQKIRVPNRQRDPEVHLADHHDGSVHNSRVPKVRSYQSNWYTKNLHVHNNWCH
mmetsp:Transcript_10871/g.22594  ORF Transcript_10871/g.22594 Transcript_10871/m.22594 type:complete len:96 (-) Transcript_10871:635-922(-)